MGKSDLTSTSIASGSPLTEESDHPWEEPTIMQIPESHYENVESNQESRIRIAENENPIQKQEKENPKTLSPLFGEFLNDCDFAVALDDDGTKLALWCVDNPEPSLDDMDLRYHRESGWGVWSDEVRNFVKDIRMIERCYAEPNIEECMDVYYAFYFPISVIQI